MSKISMKLFSFLAHLSLNSSDTDAQIYKYRINFIIYIYHLKNPSTSKNVAFNCLVFFVYLSRHYTILLIEFDFLKSTSCVMQ